MDEKTIVIGYAASSNVTFRGKIVTDITVSEWTEMDDWARNEAIQEETANLVDVWVENE